MSMMGAGWAVRRPGGVRAWSMEEIRQLRALAGEGVPGPVIANRLQRSLSAVRNKAAMHGISLRGVLGQPACL